MTLQQTFVETPIGRLRVVATRDALVAVHFPETDPRRDVGEPAPAVHAVLRRATSQLKEYFAGERTSFDLPLDPRGTPFQISVWRELADIPWGKTTSYADLARRVGRPSAARAVGAANGRNPLSIVLPCHRVVGADGSLTGYAGSLPRKAWLLAHEQRSASSVATTAARPSDRPPFYRGASRM